MSGGICADLQVQQDFFKNLTQFDQVCMKRDEKSWVDRIQRMPTIVRPSVGWHRRHPDCTLQVLHITVSLVVSRQESVSSYKHATDTSCVGSRQLVHAIQRPVDLPPELGLFGRHAARGNQRAWVKIKSHV